MMAAGPGKLPRGAPSFSVCMKSSWVCFCSEIVHMPLFVFMCAGCIVVQDDMLQAHMVVAPSRATPLYRP